MKILLIGSGGREHALAWKLKSSGLCERLYLMPGSAGMAALGERVDMDPLEVEGAARWAKEKGIGLCVVGPEGPLAAGLSDAMRAQGIPCFGPGRDGARLEASKDFSKQFMLRHGVATAQAKSFDALAPALEYALTRGFPVVTKADGLAAGKGVVVATDRAMLEQALRDCFEAKVFGAAGARVLIEDFLDGEEASLLCFSDGRQLYPMAAAQDHKRVFDGDQGPNTGGMGAYSPAPVVTGDFLAAVREKILEPTLKGFKAEGIDFRGCLYVGLMATKDGPKVVEYNVRFGDPETQVVVPRMDFDLGEVMLACAEGGLDGARLKWKDDACACVVLASGGYPGSFKKGLAVRGLDEASACEGALVFHAGTSHQGGAFATAGGRVLGISALGRDFRQALDRAYAAASKISFEGMHYRKDIGHRALARS